ncbi:MAG: hypothetical protein VYA01_05160 [Bacteroidota bacterium]|mgnify:FL=1|jgi:nucleoside phosphorylase|nr:hypothetical protein [Bacteroidota bacterium]|tara:strand:+ start:84 stop:713 length:630 start_codon:yes stop_codon:yes gene_type:complete
MADEIKEIKIETTTHKQLPSIKNGVWLASVKEETVGMPWFKHCGFGKINATRTTLLAIQAYVMVNGKMPAFVCNYGWGYGSQHGLHEITKVIESDMFINELYNTPFDDVPGILGDPKGKACATMDKVTETFIADCCDHTAYAVAKQCKEMKIDFKCFKYISPHRPFTQDKDADHYTQIQNIAWVEDCKIGAGLMRKMCEGRFGDVPSAT